MGFKNDGHELKNHEGKVPSLERGQGVQHFKLLGQQQLQELLGSKKYQFEHFLGKASKVASFPGLPTVQCCIACRGERPGLLYHANDTSVYLGRRGVWYQIEKLHFAHAFFVINKEWYLFHFTFETPVLGTESTRKGLACSFDQGPLPHLSVF